MNKRMFGAIALLAVVGGAIFNFAPEAVAPVKVGQQAPALSLPDLAGQPHGIPQGEVVILNFWATWCPPCRKEVPSMVALYEQMKDKGLKIVAISEDKATGVVVDFVRAQKMTFTVLHDADSTVARRYAVFRYPETFIIDKNGVVRQHLTGAVDWMSPKFVSYIEMLMAEPIVAQK